MLGNQDSPKETGSYSPRNIVSITLPPAKLKANSFALDHIYDKAVSKVVIEELRKKGLSYDFEIKKMSYNHDYELNSITAHYLFYFNGIKLCEHSLKAHRFEDGSYLINGSIPLNYQERDRQNNKNWPYLSKSFKKLKSQYTKKEIIHKKSSEKCYVLNNKKIYPSWKIYFTINEKSYIALIDENIIYSIKENFLHVLGYTRSYQSNKEDGTKIDESWELIGDQDSNYLNRLVSKYFEVINEKSSTNHATSTDYSFSVENTNISLSSEVNLFAATSRALKWVQEKIFL